MIPIDLWSAEGRAEMRAHLDLIGEIEEAEARLDTLRAQLPAWLDRQRVEEPPMEALFAQALADGSIESAEPLGKQEAAQPAGEEQAEPVASEPAPASPDEIAAWVEEQAAAPAPAEKPAPRKLPARDAAAIERLHAAGVAPLSIAVRLKLNIEQVRAVISGLSTHPEATDSRDPERLWTPELKAEVWAMAQDGFGVEDIAVKLAIADHRVRTLLARIREGKHPVPGGAAAAPEAPAEAAPAEEPSPAAEDPSDPERWIDDDMKAEIWRLDQEGYTPAGIAEEMSLAQRRVQNLLYRIRSGKHPVPGESSTAVATTSAGGALVVPERGVARDPEMVQQWKDDMAEAERVKFVARSEYPEMRA